MENREQYELNNHDSSMKFKDFVRKNIDKDPLRKEIADRVDDFNRCKDPVEREQLRKHIEELEKKRRQRDIQSLR